MIISSEGIVLRQRKIAGNRRMIVMFTRQYGKLSAGTSINEKSRNRSALALRPFTLAEYELFKGREAYSVNSASVKKSYYSIGEDLDKFAAASAVIEYLDKVLQEGEPMPALYELSVEFMESLSRTDGDPMTLLYAFIVKTFRLLGVMPELGCCVNCGRPIEDFDSGTTADGKGRIRMLSVSSGGVICEDCANVEKTDPTALIYRPFFDIIDVIRFFLNKPIKTFEKVRLKPEVSEYIRQVLGEYTRIYLDADVLSKVIEMEAGNGYQS